MTKIITYSLKNTDKDSDKFYTDLAVFTDQVLRQAEVELGEVLDAFLGWLRENDAEEERTRMEYIFDLLVIGVLWQVYASEAVQSSGGAQNFLMRLVEARKKYPRLKPIVDWLRGLLGGFLFHRGFSKSEHPDLNVHNFGRLATWLAAAGDFKEEVRRLELWGRFFAKENDLVKYLAIINNFAIWFENTGLAAFGKYTPNVEQFLQSAHPAYRWREDYIFTGRQRVEYHLYMLGMEIMNRAFRARFLTAQQKIMFVPPCMAAPQDGTCQAKDTPYGAQCAHCTPDCQVNQITRYGQKNGVQVFMIPDSFSPLSEGGGDGMKNKSLGVVGVSCPVTITAGGFEMRRLGIPAQGVMLEHCGCSWHWALGNGVVTEINFRQLIRTLSDEE